MYHYEKTKQTLLAELHSNQETGLRALDIPALQVRHGKNQFEEQKGEGIFKKVVHTLSDISVIILLIAAALSLFMGIYHGEGYVEAIVILSIVVLNVFLAITQELGAEKSLAALKSLNSATTIVLRDGAQVEIDSAEVVPGDIILLKTGDLIPADARILESFDLFVDESILTGESEPSEKNADAELEGKVALGDQANMLFSSCLVTAGRATAIVVATGMHTQIGRIAGLLNDAQKLKTPLQTRLDKIGKVISFIAILSALVLIAVGIYHGRELRELVFAAVALAVAAVPETLSLIVTLNLINGVKEMAEKNALILKLPAVETLGSTSIICTDKTGTLTQNRMTIKLLWHCGDDDCYEETGDFSDEGMQFLSRLALVNNAIMQEDGIIGDPTETAILRLANEKGINKEDLEKDFPRIHEISFSSERKMMTTIHKDSSGGYLVLTKGAFDRVPFEAASQDKKDIAKKMHDNFAKDALRVIALGSKHIDELPPEDKLHELEKDLVFEGIIGIIDPLRPEVADSIRTAKKAGIRTIMITGDHKTTATAIAAQAGLLGMGDKVLTGIKLSEMSDEELIENIDQYSVYARVSPEDKIRIVEAWQEQGEVVAMTGDGVNDAPALKAADVGISMGIAGTEVAKSASDMILIDDNFSTIVTAAHKGRDVFSNIRKTIYFLVVCNFSEIIIMLGAALVGWGMPLTPIMLLLINVLGDGIPGIHLAREKSDLRIMKRKPIGREESLFEGLVLVIAVQTAAFAIVSWIGYYIGTNIVFGGGLAPSHEIGQTMCFLIVGWTSILHIFTVRSRKSVFKRTLRDNPKLAISAFAMIFVFAMLVFITPIGNIFGMTAIGFHHWVAVIYLSLIPIIASEIGKFIKHHKEKNQYKHRLVQHLPEAS